MGSAISIMLFAIITALSLTINSYVTRKENQLYREG